MKLVIAAPSSENLKSAIHMILREIPGGIGDITTLGGISWDAQERSIGEDGLAAARAILASKLGGTSVDYAFAPEDNRKKRLLVSDMDSTIIGQECIDELADLIGKKDEVAEITERAMRGELDFEGALTTRVKMLEGLPEDKLQECFDTRITLNDGARTVVRTMMQNGARCVLVSGGFTYFTQRVAQIAGFHADRANTLIIENGQLTGDVGRPILGREAKLTALNEECAQLGLTAADALAMGDGANDLAMIEAAGMGLAYRAKPVVAAQADVVIQGKSLIPALFYQGYSESEFVTD